MWPPNTGSSLMCLKLFISGLEDTSLGICRLLNTTEGLCSGNPVSIIFESADMHMNANFYAFAQTHLPSPQVRLKCPILGFLIPAAMQLLACLFASHHLVAVAPAFLPSVLSLLQAPYTCLA